MDLIHIICLAMCMLGTESLRGKRKEIQGFQASEYAVGGFSASVAVEVKAIVVPELTPFKVNIMEIYVFLRKIPFGLLHIFAVLLALTADPSGYERKMKIRRIACGFRDVATEMTYQLLQVVMVIAALLSVAFSLMPYYALDLIPFGRL